MNELRVDERAKGLIFDLDGTLADSMPLHLEAWRELCQLKNVDFTSELFYSLAGVPSNRILEIVNEQHGTDFDPEKDSMHKEEIYMAKMKHMKPVEEVVAIAKAYHGKLPMSIGTGSPTGHSWETVKYLGLDKYFDILIGRDDVKNGKPAPDTFLLCAEKMGIAPEHCQVFEDGDPGLEAAKSAGMIGTDIRPFV